MAKKPADKKPADKKPADEPSAAGSAAPKVRAGRKAAPPPAVPSTGPLAARIVAAPRLGEAGAGPDTVDRWLAGLGRGAEGKALNAVLTAWPAVGALLAGLAEGSPYLWELASAEPDRLLRCLDADPDERFAALMAEHVAAIDAAADDAEAMRLLRLLKAEAALVAALADIGGVWPVMRVTRALTELADTAVGTAVRHLLRGAAAQGRLVPADPARPEVGSGYIVLAMGKMGAFELNYSSDIDLIVLFDADRAPVAPGTEAAPLYIRITRGLVKLLQERNADGYVFRTDLRLRPDPASTQIAISTAAALSYYESTGQNWERAAMIKARPCAGDVAAGEAFLKEVAPFIWRKYLDYAAVADVHAMKRQIHAYKGHDQIAIEGHNVKLGRGGIREIEFFAQTQQLIAGGRHPILRGRETLATLATLADGGWIKPEAARDLTEAYGFLRTVEHRLQMVADEQTQTLPSEPEEVAAFARFLGYADRDAFAGALVERLRVVERHYANLFEETPKPPGAERPLAFPPEANDRGTLEHLAERGFRQPVEASETIRRWLSGAYRSLRGETARGYLAELVPLFVDRLARTDAPDRALQALDRFLAQLAGGARLYSLLRQNPDLVALLSLILGTAPRLAEIVASQPDVMDALLDPAFFGALPDGAALTRRLAASLAEAATYEDFLDRTRLFGHEQMFLIGVRILSGTVSAEQAGEAFARLADVLIRAMHRAVEARFAAAHGRVSGQASAVVALGKLGGREMTAGSDLDLILVYDFDPERPESDGERPLYGGHYFARLTQRLISAVTAQTNYGVLYEVDMRLRPSGRSGPVATRLDGFRDYQEREAWTWEHLALTRARVVSADPGFAAEVETVIRDVLARPRDPDTIAADVVEMRGAIAEEKGDAEPWDLKYAAGGLVDLEFIAQYLQLVNAHAHPEILDTHTGRVFDKAHRLGLISAEDAEVLRPAARLYLNLTQILRLCLTAPLDPKAVGSGLLGLLTRAADVPDFPTLEAHLAETQQRVRATFVRILGRAP